MLFGTGVFSFGAIGLVINVRNSLEEKEKKFHHIFLITSALIICVYNIFGIFGVLGLGNQMKEIVIFALPNRGDAAFFQILYALALAMSYPL